MSTMPDAKYWLYEDPEVLNTGKNVVRYYPKADRLVVHLPDYQLKGTGEQKIGKGVGLNLSALRDHPEVTKRLLEILGDL